MVAIVTGAGLGVVRASGYVLGSRGQLGTAAFGPNSENVTVNAANGNLNILRTDEIVLGQGSDGIVNLAYNSLGTGTDDNGDNWSLGPAKTVTHLTGVLNTLNSTITRIDWDGSQTVYSYVVNGPLAGSYVAKEGSGAYDTLTWQYGGDVDNTWIWKDGDTGLTEQYDVGAVNPRDPSDAYWGRLSVSLDREFNATSYSWSGNLLTDIYTTGGDHVQIVYSGNNIQEIDTFLADGTSLTRTRYHYTANRLDKVTTDLSPADGSTADGNTYVETYGYDVNGRVNQIHQSNNNFQINVAYDSLGRVASFTQVMDGTTSNTTNFTYNTLNTIVTDPQGIQTRLTYDPLNELTQIDYGYNSVGNSAKVAQETVHFAYDGNGNVISATDGNNKITQYGYDITTGNMTSMTAPDGNATSWTYNAMNEVLTETHSFTDQSTGTVVANTTRYAYDIAGNLHYKVSALGEVTEYKVGATEKPQSVLVYRDNVFPIAGLGSSTSIAESALDTWVAGIADKSTVERSDYTYDYRGNLSSVTTYSKANVHGKGLTTAPYTITHYVYDQYGSLLSRYVDGEQGEAFVYDGLGRVISATSATGAVTTTTYVVNNYKLVTTITSANSRVETDTYDAAGHLISSRETGTDITSSAIKYAYDADGNLRMVTDALGNNTYFLYDSIGRKVADINSTGALVEYRYDAVNRLVATIRYVNLISPTALGSLIDANGNPANVALADITPTTNLSGDSWEWRIYDVDSRLVEVINSVGATRDYTYNGLNEVQSLQERQTTLTALQLNTLRTTAPTSPVNPTATAAQTSTTYYYYDSDGRLAGVLDPDGFVTAYGYDTAGQKIQETRYASAPTSPSNNLVTTLQSIAASAQDQTTRYVYDDEGNLRYSLDPGMAPTEYVYDNQDRLIATYKYGAAVSPPPAGGSYTVAYVTSQISGFASSTAFEGSWNIYDQQGRVIETIGPTGTVTDFTYDTMSNLLSSDTYATLLSAATLAGFRTAPPTAVQAPAATADDRTTTYIYDADRRVVGTIDANGYLTQTIYDARGEKTDVIVYVNKPTVKSGPISGVVGSMTATARDTHLRYFYDTLGRLEYLVDGTLAVTEYRYDNLNRVVATFQYADSIAAPSGSWSTAYVAGQITALNLIGNSQTRQGWSIYDSAGRVIETIDSTGAAVSFTYNGENQLTGSRRYATRLTAGVVQGFYTVPPTGTVFPTADAANDRLAYYSYDQNGWLRYAIDTALVPTEYHYNGVGELLSTYTYSGSIASVASLAPADIAAQIASANLMAAGTVRELWSIYDALGRVVQTIDGNGTVENRTYDALGNLVSVKSFANVLSQAAVLAFEATPPTTVQTVSGSSADQVTTYYYDAAGRTVGTIDPNGYVTKIVYNAFGQKSDIFVYANKPLSTAGSFDTIVGTIPASTDDVHTRYFYDNDGHLRFMLDSNLVPTEYRYDQLGDVIAVYRYASGLTATGSYPTTAAVASAITAQLLLANPSVQELWSIYDVDGRVVQTIDGAGNVTSSTYNGAGELVATRAYATVLSPATVTGFETAPPTTVQTVATTVADTVTNYYYDGEGRLIGTMDGDGGIAEAIYNAFGEKTESIAFVNKPVVTTGAFTAIVNSIATSAGDVHTHYLYDTDGRLRFTVSGTLDVTEYRYDGTGNMVALYKYATPIAAPGSFTTANIAAAVAALAPNTANESAWSVYDSNGEVLETIDALGEVITFTYDAFGNLTSTRQYLATLTSTQVHGFKTTPPTALVLPSADNSKDRITTNYYDADNRLIGTLDADGYVQQTIYNAFGQVTDSIAYANKPANTAGAFLSVIVPSITLAPAADTHTRYYYDLEGRLKYVLDSNKVPTEYDYDGAGNLLHTIAYAAALTGAVPATTAAMATAIAAQNLASVGVPRVNWSVYDADGRTAYEIDGLGAVTSYSYDGTGHVVKKIQFSTPRTTSSDPSAATMAAWVTSNTTTSDRVCRYFYDAAGRMVYEMDGENYVTKHVFNAAGQLTSDIRYAGRYSATDTTRTLDGIVPANPPSDAVVTQYQYDPAGRVSHRIDGENFITTYVYDGLGRVISTTEADGTADSATTKTSYDGAGRVATQTDGMNGVTQFVYDGLGNLQQQTDALLNVTSFTYDQMGRMKSKTTPIDSLRTATVQYEHDAFGNLTAFTDALLNRTSYVYDAVGNLVQKTEPVDGATTAVTHYQYDVFGDLLVTTDPLNIATYNFYDNDGQLVLHIDGENYYTQYAYTAFGQAKSVTQGWAKITAPFSAGQPPSVIPPTPGSDETSKFFYDNLGRLKQLTDATNASEYYGLDSFGNEISFTNKLNAVILKTYDKRGLLKTETLPETVYVGASGTPEKSQVVNSYYYDGRGNRTQAVLGSNTNEARTTTYVYDDNDRVTRQYTDAVGYYNATNWTSAGNAVLNTYFKYDANNNLIEQDSPSGARTLFYYNMSNQKIGQISETDASTSPAKGTYSAWDYDLNGNMKSEQVYSLPIALPVTPGGPPPVDTDPSRLTTYTYYKNNQLKTTTVSSANALSWEYGQTDASATPITVTNTYDLDGNLVKQTDARNNTSWFFYDKRGLKIAQVDQDKYLTKYDLDAFGNVTTEYRYAKAYGGTLTVGVTPSIGGNADLVNDRTTDFTYDLMNRCLTESRRAVIASSFDSNWNKTDASVASTIVYTYNALGEVASKAQATGDITNYTYDQLGRQTQSATYDNQGTLYDTVDEYFDAFDEISRSVENARLGGLARITSYTYDQVGRQATVTDAMNNTRSNFYDKDGNLLVSEYQRTQTTGPAKTEADLYRYDALGRVIYHGKGVQNTDLTWDQMNLDYTQMKYDTFGEVVAKGSNGAYQESYVYDDAGRMIQSNAGDGITKFYLYDANGHQTAMFETSGVALTSGALSAMQLSDVLGLVTTNHTQAIGAVDVTGLVMTFTTYDARDQALSTVAPFRQLDSMNPATETTLTTSQTYNAFGEVKSQTDANTNVTTYAYNTLGKVILETLPTVNVMALNGSVAPGTPQLQYFYDISGRMIETIDADQGSHWTKRSLLAGTGYDGTDALTLQEYHPDNGTLSYTYDAFNDVIKENTNAIVGTVGAGANQEHDDSLSYDNLGRLKEVDHQSGLKDYYTYDELGQRLTHSNNVLVNGAGQKVYETTDYDAQGRVTKSSDFDGHVTSYSYVWQASAAETGFGDFGGWKKVTNNQAAAVDAWQITDYFGNLVSKEDFGNNDYTYTFDLAGRVLTETDGTTGSFIDGYVFTYLNTGMTASKSYGIAIPGGLTDMVGDYYAYDNNGNMTKDTAALTGGGIFGYPVTTTYYGAKTMKWDAENRMTDYTDPGMQIVTTPYVTVIQTALPVAVHWDYDLAGNIQHMLTKYTTIDTTTGAPNATPLNGTQDYYYLYDAMNRFTLSEGTLNGSHVIVAGATGSTITYNRDGTRGTVTNGKDGTVETYTYNTDGDITAMSGTGGSMGTFSATYFYDLMDRLTYQYEYSASALVYSRVVTGYTNTSLVTADDVWTKRSDNTTIDTSSNYSYTDSAGHFLGGAQTGSTSHQLTNGGNALNSTTTNVFTWWDSAQQSTATTVPSSGPTVQTTYIYDNFGHLSQVSFTNPNGGSTSRSITYYLNTDGQIQERQESESGGSYTNSHPTEFYYYFDGFSLGDVGNDGSSNVDYAASITQQRQTPANPAGPFRGGTNPGQAYGDFDQNYQAINGYSQSNPTTYTATSGETLQSVAGAVWGDSSLWYLIAQANGLDAGSTLVTGQVLIIPSRVTNLHNTSSTFKVYDASSMLGNLSPTLPQLPPKKQHTPCGIFGQILQAIVTIVVTVVTGGNAVLGDIAGQLFGMAIGNQKGFNWAELGKSVIASLVGGPLPDAGPVEAAIEAAAADAVTQGISIAIGLQKKFDWAEVASAGIGEGVGREVGGLVKGDFTGTGSDLLNDGLRIAIKATARDLAEAATRSLINGSDFGDNVVSALPGSISQAVGDELQNSEANNAQKSGDGTSAASGAKDSDSGAQEIFNDLNPSHWFNGFTLLGTVEREFQDWWANNIDPEMTGRIKAIQSTNFPYKVGVVDGQLQILKVNGQPVAADVTPAPADVVTSGNDDPIHMSATARSDIAGDEYDWTVDPDTGQKVFKPVPGGDQSNIVFTPDGKITAQTWTLNSTWYANSQTETLVRLIWSGDNKQNAYLWDGQTTTDFPALGVVVSLESREQFNRENYQAYAASVDAYNAEVARENKANESTAYRFVSAFGGELENAWHAGGSLLKFAWDHPWQATVNTATAIGHTVVAVGELAEKASTPWGQVELAQDVINGTVNIVNQHIQAYENGTLPELLGKESADATIAVVGGVVTDGVLDEALAVASPLLRTLAPEALDLAGDSAAASRTLESTEGAGGAEASAASRADGFAPAADSAPSATASEVETSGMASTARPTTGLDAGGIVADDTATFGGVSSDARAGLNAPDAVPADAARPVVAATDGEPAMAAAAPTMDAVPAVSEEVAPMGYCFVAGTLVHTASGLKPIEEIEIGERVLSQPEFGGAVGYRRVVDTFSLGEHPVVEVAFRDAAGALGTLRATGPHPFWVQGRGWTEAKDLVAGNRLQQGEGGEAEVVSVSDTGTREAVFNFAVDGFHTYYVGTSGIWVHNACRVGDIPSAPASYEGGAYGRLSAERGVIERHHIPADSVSPHTTYSGPAIQMDQADHLLTSSHGSQGLAGALYRSEIKGLIEDGNMRDAVAREISDVRRVSTQATGVATKYNSAIREMLDYAYSKGFLNKGL